VSGRRVYPRFQQTAPARGQIRLSRDVVVQADQMSGHLLVLSETPAVAGERLTLTLVSSTGERDLEVTVMDSRPHVAGGVMKHQLRLAHVAPDAVPDQDSRSEQ
jgi:hypothetical protein